MQLTVHKYAWKVHSYNAKLHTTGDTLWSCLFSVLSMETS